MQVTFAANCLNAEAAPWPLCVGAHFLHLSPWKKKKGHGKMHSLVLEQAWLLLSFPFLC